MKRIIPVLTIAALTSLAACSGKPTSETTEIETFSRPAPVVAARDTSRDTIVMAPPMTSQGVGPVRIGMKLSALPMVLPGAYDSVAVDRTEPIEGLDQTAAVTFYSRGLPVMLGRGVEEPPVLSELTVVGRGPSVTIDGRRFGVGARRADIARCRGIVVRDDGCLEWRRVVMQFTADTVASLTIERPRPTAPV